MRIEINLYEFMLLCMFIMMIFCLSTIVHNNNERAELKEIIKNCQKIPTGPTYETKIR